MIRRDLKSNQDSQQSIAPAARTASVNGAWVDTLGFQAILAELSLGAWTDGSFSFKLQGADEDDKSDAADIAAADLLGAFTTVDGADDDNTVQRVGYIGTKRYIRVVGTEAGGSPAPGTGLVFGANIIRGLPNMAPLS